MCGSLGMQGQCLGAWENWVCYSSKMWVPTWTRMFLVTGSWLERCMISKNSNREAIDAASWNQSPVSRALFNLLLLLSTHTSKCSHIPYLIKFLQNSYSHLYTRKLNLKQGTVVADLIRPENFEEAPGHVPTIQAKAFWNLTLRSAWCFLSPCSILHTFFSSSTALHHVFLMASFCS